MGKLFIPNKMKLVLLAITLLFALASANPSTGAVPAFRPWLATRQGSFQAAGIRMDNSPRVTNNQGGDRDDDPFVPTRDPEPTEIDSNDPKGKQKAIHVAPSFEEYMKQRAAGN